MALAFTRWDSTFARTAETRSIAGLLTRCSVDAQGETARARLLRLRVTCVRVFSQGKLDVQRVIFNLHRRSKCSL